MQFIPINQQLLVLSQYQMPHKMFQIMTQLGRFERGAVSACSIIKMLCMQDLIDAAYVMEFGAAKYEQHNWMRGMKWSVPLACISRHVQAMVVLEEEIDHESGLPHWGHVVCNLLMLQHYELYYQEGDDRPPEEMFL